MTAPLISNGGQEKERRTYPHSKNCYVQLYRIVYTKTLKIQNFSEILLIFLPRITQIKSLYLSPNSSAQPIGKLGNLQMADISRPGHKTRLQQYCFFAENPV